MPATVLPMTSRVRAEIEDSFYLEALLVALVGAARAQPLSNELLWRLGDFGQEFGAALRLDQGMCSLERHRRLRAIAERAIQEAADVLKD